MTSGEHDEHHQICIPRRVQPPSPWAPNVSKSTIFNMLTGLNQHVGNWQAKPSSAAPVPLSTMACVEIIDARAYCLTPEGRVARDISSEPPRCGVSHPKHRGAGT